MADNRLDRIVKEITTIIGPCSFDEESTRDDVVELAPVDFVDIGIEISDKSKISIFANFSYSDYSYNEIAESDYDHEELEAEIQTFLYENSFFLFFSDHSLKFAVAQWDDGHFMCPGFVARVGFLCEEYSEMVVREFIRIYHDYTSTIAHYDAKSLRLYIIETLLRKRGIKAIKDTGIYFCDASIHFLDRQTLPESNVESYYWGAEKFLFTSDGEQYAVDVMPIKLFYEAISLCELHDSKNLRLEYLPLFKSRMLHVYTSHLTFSLPVFQNEQQIYSHIEETNALASMHPFLPFASDKFKDAYYLAYSGLLDDFSGKDPLVITEGSTDWKHIKKYWDTFESAGPKIKFYEYEPLNSKKDANNKLDMGSSTLLEMCKSYSKLGIGKPLIFIADRDEQRIIKEMGSNSGYKNWGNSVFSFVLPVPDHRVSTPDVCIEHYYSDEDISTYFLCDDGIKRRLYLGKDFDEYGRNISDGLLCTKRNLCGISKMKVIDGSSDAKVISFSGDAKTNFALSKQEFAEKITITKESPAYYAFRKLANMIKEIVRSATK